MFSNRLSLSNDTSFSLSNVESKLAVAVALILLSPSAFAAQIEIPNFSEIITFIGGLSTAVSAIGLAMLSLFALAKAFKLVKAAF